MLRRFTAPAADSRKAGQARTEDSPPILAADLYCDILPDPKLGWRQYAPGLVVVTSATLAAAFLADLHDTPLTLMALLVGLSLNFLSSDRRLAPGLAFASRSLLRWGIVCLGARLTLGEMFALGPVALAGVIAIVAMVMGCGVLIARRLGYDSAFGVLAGGAVAICGASAAMALSAVLGERRISQAQLALVLVGISGFSAAAMVLYPLVANFLELSDRQAGFVMGGAIHDVAQAIGAGYAFSPQAGNVAAVVKLTRVALLAPALMLVAALWGRNTGARGIGVPWFVAGFFLVALFNSFHLLPPAVVSGAEGAATAFLAVAIAATGIQAPLSRLRAGGIRPMLVIGLATLASLLLSLLVAAALHD